MSAGTSTSEANSTTTTTTTNNNNAPPVQEVTPATTSSKWWVVFGAGVFKGVGFFSGSSFEDVVSIDCSWYFKLLRLRVAGFQFESPKVFFSDIDGPCKIWSRLRNKGENTQKFRERAAVNWLFFVWYYILLLLIGVVVGIVLDYKSALTLVTLSILLLVVYDPFGLLKSEKFQIIILFVAVEVFLFFVHFQSVGSFVLMFSIFPTLIGIHCVCHQNSFADVKNMSNFEKNQQKLSDYFSLDTNFSEMFDFLASDVAERHLSFFKQFDPETVKNDIKKLTHDQELVEARLNQAKEKNEKNMRLHKQKEDLQQELSTRQKVLEAALQQKDLQSRETQLKQELADAERAREQMRQREIDLHQKLDGLREKIADVRRRRGLEIE